MNNYRFGDLQRVSKAKARKLYNAGISILLVPCKARPDSRWCLGLHINKSDGEDPDYSDFDKRVLYFEAYNCQYNEIGRYAAYYVRES